MIEHTSTHDLPAVKSTSFAGDSVVRRYEDAFATTVGAKFASSFWKGRTALYAILKALGVGPGDEVILPAFTCVVVPNAVLALKAVPVYADILPGTYAVDPQQVRKLVSPRTRALLVQHTFGIPAEIDALLDIAYLNGLAVIEDCAHALGSTYRDRFLGNFGIASFFSTQWSKPFTTGLGGMAVTSDPAVAIRLKQIQQTCTPPPARRILQLGFQHWLYTRFFSSRSYWMARRSLNLLSGSGFFVASSEEGELRGETSPDLNWRLSSHQARSGLQGLEKVSEQLAHRRELAAFYERALGIAPLNCFPPATEVVFLRYPFRVVDKWSLLRKAEKARLELGSWFESPLHPVCSGLERFGYQEGSCPEAESAARHVINLPLHPRISQTEAARIVRFLAGEL